MPSDKSLKKSMNGVPAQTYHPISASYQESYGSDNAPHMKITDPDTGEPIDPREVKDVDVLAELQAIKQTQNEIMTRLDRTFDAQLTGSILEVHTLFVGEIIPPESSLVFFKTFKGSSFGITGRFESSNSNVSARYHFNEYKDESNNRRLSPFIDLFTDTNFISTKDEQKAELTTPTVRFEITNSDVDREVETRHLYITDFV